MTSVTATISTKGRYNTTLPIAIASIINQTVPPQKFILYDDGEHKDIRLDPTYRHLLLMLNDRNIVWSVVFGDRKGQVLNHQKAIDSCTTDWIWRVDDDDMASPQALEMLLQHANDDSVGAVGGLILTSGNIQFHTGFASSRIEDIYTTPNLQWFMQEGVKEVDHFNNSFLFRKQAAAHGYCKELSPVGHREETLFTYGMKRAGWKLLLEPKAITWHLRNPDGGIRSYQDRKMFDDDEEVFSRYLADWGVKPIVPFHVVLDSGLGDHIAFKRCLPDLKAKHPDRQIVVAACYPGVFYDEPNLKIISINEAKDALGDISVFNIYRWMIAHNWKGRLYEAYHSMYIDGAQ